MIEIHQLTKSYGERTVVQVVSFTSPAHGVIGLLGPNGAGKTTLMRMLTTYLAPSSGTASVAGYDICRNAAKVRESIGYLPEVPPLYRELRVSEQLRFVGKMRGLSGAKLKDALDRVRTQFSLFDVWERLDLQLSQGFRQRVGLAQAILHQPQVVILDEPTTGLDPQQMVEVRGFISQLGKDCLVLLSTHLLSEVAQTCTAVVILNRGKVVCEGPLAEVTKELSLEELFLRSVIRAEV